MKKKKSFQRFTRDSDESRLKKLEFLMKIADTETSNAVRAAHLLSIGNAGAIAVGFLLLKDLSGKFSERSVLLAMLMFAGGLFSAGLFYLKALQLMLNVRAAIKDYVFNNKDIKPLQSQMDNWESPIMVKLFINASILSFAFGAAIILSQAASLVTR